MPNARDLTQRLARIDDDGRKLAEHLYRVDCEPALSAFAESARALWRLQSVTDLDGFESCVAEAETHINTAWLRLKEHAERFLANGSSHG